jgi:hypothetical protein
MHLKLDCAPASSLFCILYAKNLKTCFILKNFVSMTTQAALIPAQSHTWSIITTARTQAASKHSRKITRRIDDAAVVDSDIMSTCGRGDDDAAHLPEESRIVHPDYLEQATNAVRKHGSHRCTCSA